jgi:hypothetical protein
MLRVDNFIVFESNARFSISFQFQKSRKSTDKFVAKKEKSENPFREFSL